MQTESSSMMRKTTRRRQYHKKHHRYHHRHNHHRYLVHTATCHLPEWPLFDEQTGPLYRNLSQTVYHCAQPDSVYIGRSQNGTALYIPALGVNKKLICKADTILPSLTDSAARFGTRYGPLRSVFTTFPETVHAVQVRCRQPMRLVNGMSAIAVVAKKVVPLIPFIKPKRITTSPPLSSKSSTTTNDHQPPQINVLLLGLDSVSALQFRRHFHQSRLFLERKGFQPLYGYTKIGDNTFPNLIGVLTGHHYTTYWNATIGHKMKFDALPFIWKQYSNSGYLTTLVEDMPMFSLFNYNRAGFRHPPTDYYLRPVSVLVDDDVNNHFCYKNQLTIEYYYDWIYDQVVTLLKRNQPFFTFTHLADVTHNVYHNAAYVDAPLVKLLNQLFQLPGVPQRTFVVVYSDHGIRFGALRRTQSGAIEERLPFMYVYVPAQMSGAAKARRALHHNAHRLTSHFDLHATLRHIVSGNATGGDSDDQDQDPYGQTLLRKISANRTCDQAGIDQHWCLCGHYRPLPSGTKIGEKLANFVVMKINQLLHSGGDRIRNNCIIPLMLDRVKHVSVKDEKDDDEDQTSTSKIKKLFLIQLQTKPGNALYEATVQWIKILRSSSSSSSSSSIQQPSNITLSLLGEVSRLDSYHNQLGDCVLHDAIREKFCFCRSQLKFASSSSPTSSTK